MKRTITAIALSLLGITAYAGIEASEVEKLCVPAAVQQAL